MVELLKQMTKEETKEETKLLIFEALSTDGFEFPGTLALQLTDYKLLTPPGYLIFYCGLKLKIPQAIMRP